MDVGNVLHHIPDAGAFFREASRCLKPGGRIFIVDQYAGWPSSWIYDACTMSPSTPTPKTDALTPRARFSGANGALAKIILERDLAKFQQTLPQFAVTAYHPHSPFRYWLCGGLKRWTLLPSWAFPVAIKIDRALMALSPKFGSVVDIELEKPHD